MAIEKNEIQKLCSYLHRVTDKVEKHVQTLRSQMEQGVISWDECEQLAEASNLAEWIGCQVHQVEGLAKDQRFSLGYLYRCKKSDPWKRSRLGGSTDCESGTIRSSYAVKAFPSVSV